MSLSGYVVRRLLHIVPIAWSMRATREKFAKRFEAFSSKSQRKLVSDTFTTLS